MRLQAVGQAPQLRCGSVKTLASTMQVVGNSTDVSTPGKNADFKVDQLRKEMAAADGGKGVHAYIIPTEDPHMVCKQFQRYIRFQAFATIMSIAHLLTELLTYLPLGARLQIQNTSPQWVSWPSCSQLLPIPSYELA